MNVRVSQAFKVIEDEIVSYLKENGVTSAAELSAEMGLNGNCDPVSGQPGWAFGFFYTRLLEQGRVKLIQERRGARKYFEAT